MLEQFRFEEAEKALCFVLRLNSSDNIEDKLNEAKKIYDFLIGKSHHFNESNTPKIG